MQWPAMAVTVYSSWLLTSTSKRRRCMGFVGFLISNVLWTLWAVPAGVYAVVLLQICLALLNLRGLQKNR